MLSDVDACILSYEVGVVKPDAAIFQQVEQPFGVDKAHILLVGSSPF